MPATDSETTPSSSSAHNPTGGKKGGLFARLCTWEPLGTRIVVWLVGATVVTSAMGSAVNHFLNGRLVNDEASGNGKASGGSSGSWSGAGVWWNPNSATSAGSASSSRGAAPSSHAGASVIPVERGAGFASGSLILNGLSPVGSNSPREAYAILGLGTKSAGLTPGAPNSNFSSSAPALHFSLSGDLNRVPVDNLAAGGLSLNFAAVPEPTTALMLAIGLASLALQRPRRPSSRA